MHIVFLFLAATGAAASPGPWTQFGELLQDSTELSQPALTEAKVAEIQKQARGWTAKMNSRFEGASLAEAKKLMGTLYDPEFRKLPLMTFDAPKDLPTDFDWREASDCASVKEIRDQANCGSCWAFGSVEAMTDRICIASNGTQTPHLSAQDVTSCCHLGDMGCNGGVPPTAYTYWNVDGIVTGGNYGDLSMCWSYQKAPCAHHSNSSDYPDCPEENRTPSCSKACTDDTSLDWDTDKSEHKGSGYQFSSVDDMLQDLYENGPLTAQFMVYEDFLAYESGVYEHSTGGLLGGHAIKIIGFGEEDGTPYWTVANSWNEEWGDGGFFKIKRGSNECQIENFVINGGPVGGSPQL